MKTCSAIETLKVLGVCLFLASCGPAEGDEAYGQVGKTQFGVDAENARRPPGTAGTTVVTVLVGPSPTDAAPTADAAVGVACATASDCSTGFCVDGVCCDTACTESCRSCGLSARPGICSPVIGAQDPGTCEGENSCDEIGACGQTLGKACSTGGECASGSCVDGVCCGQQACGTCETCNLPGSVGSCAPLPALSDDANAACAGVSTCDGVGGCKQKNGSTCSSAASCASGLCVDGLCCNDACAGTCHSCAFPGHEGTCSVVAGQQDAVATVSCVGENNTCDALGSGTCKLQDGATCAQDADCAFSKCQAYYGDADGDGYGAPATAHRRCDVSPKPRAGEISVGGDCCDKDPKVHPGQTAYSSAQSACGSYDYDCSGGEELQYRSCGIAAMSAPVPGCGGICEFKAPKSEYVVYVQACR
jgi:hypothetical protein